LLNIDNTDYDNDLLHIFILISLYIPLVFM